MSITTLLDADLAQLAGSGRRPRGAAGRRAPKRARTRSPSPSAIDGLPAGVQRVELGGTPSRLARRRAAGRRPTARARRRWRVAPRPGSASNASVSGTFRPRSRAARRSAAARGCSEWRFDRGGERRARSSSRPSSAVIERQLRQSERQRAGLVDRDGAHGGEVLQGLAALDEDPAAGGAADGGDDGHRHGDDQRARAGDDEQRQRAVDPGVEVAAERERNGGERRGRRRRPAACRCARSGR